MPPGLSVHDAREHELAILHVDRDHILRTEELARMLDQGIADGRCAGLVLVASSPFLGHLKAHLGVQARKAIVRTVDAAYTALRDTDLAERLAEPEDSV